MSTDQVFERIVAAGKEKLRFEEIGAELETMGIGREDIPVIIDFIACIAYFDSKLFPRPVEKFEFSSSEDDDIMFTFEDGSYVIFAEDIVSYIAQESFPVVVFGNEWKPEDAMPYKPRKATLKEKLIAFAAMAVRLRWQDCNEDSMLDPADVYCSSEVNSYLILMGGCNCCQCEDDDFSSYSETDSSVIGAMVLGRMESGADENGIVQVIGLKATSVSPSE